MTTIFKTHENKSQFKQWVEIATHEKNLIMEISRDTNLVVRFYDSKKRLKYFIDYNNQTVKEYRHTACNYNRILAEYIKLYYKDNNITDITNRLDEGAMYTCKENEWTDVIQGNSITRTYTDGTTYKRIFIKQ